MNSVVGCHDVFGANFCHPPLTTLTSPIVDGIILRPLRRLCRHEPHELTPVGFDFHLNHFAAAAPLLTSWGGVLRERVY